jgi:hypothetical protein
MNNEYEKSNFDKDSIVLSIMLTVLGIVAIGIILLVINLIC